MTEIKYNQIHQKAVNGGKVMSKESVAVCTRIKSLRKESRLTQEQMASYLEVDQSFVTKLENGTRKLNVDLIEKLCSLFGCTEEYLMGESGDYLPLNFAFRSGAIQAEDLQSIAVLNRIAMNLLCMDELMGES